MKKIVFGPVAVLALGAIAFAGPGSPISTTSTIQFTENPAYLGDSVTVTASISPSITDTGVLRVELNELDGVPVSCETAGSSFVTLYSTDILPISSVGGLADTTVVGTFGYRAHFIPAGGSSFHESQSPCVDFEVLAPTGCTGGLQIAATEASGTNLPVSKQPWTGGFVITVSNCAETTAPGVTAQGGSNAWATITGFLPDTGSVAVKKQTGGGNQILLWTIGDMDAQAVANLTVNLSATIKGASGTILTVNGPWSALSGGVKTNYTGQVTLTIQ